MAEAPKKRVLLVCMGNICRSPTAEGVLKKIIKDNGLDEIVEVDSAGTHGYHAGEAPDPRALAAAAKRGYELKGLRARKVRRDDFALFDLVLAMDRENLANLLEICPPVYQERVRLFLSYASEGGSDEVPDPYFGGPAGFEVVLDMIEEAARGLVESMRSTG